MDRGQGVVHGLSPRVVRGGLWVVILVPRSSVSFGHVVGETEALVSAVINSCCAFIFYQPMKNESIFSMRPGLLVSGAKKKKREALGTRMRGSMELDPCFVWRPLSVRTQNNVANFPLPRGGEPNSSPCIPRHIPLVGPGSYPRGKPMTFA